MKIDTQTGIIRMMRGDSLIIPIAINEGTALDPSIRSLADNEELHFALMEPNKAFEDAVVKKVLNKSSEVSTDGNLLLTLEPRDTEKLLVGKYYYVVKLFEQQSDGKALVKTIIRPTLFWIEGNNPEVDVTETGKE